MQLLLLILIFLALLTVARATRLVNQYERSLVIFLGKYRHTVGPGLTILIPFVEDLIKVDMRERVINVAPQKVITKDNVTVLVDAVIYFKVIDPVKAEFEVQDFDLACTTLAQTNLRNLIGDKNLDDTLVARDVINTSLREVLDEATNAWGVKITRVEVQKIDPPTDITDAMSKQMKAEREKRAVVLEAEGYKQSQILQAEGDKEATILRAAGEAEAVRKVAEAAESYFKERAQILKKLDVLEKTLQENTKIIIPSGSEVINVLGLTDKETTILPLKEKPKREK